MSGNILNFSELKEVINNISAVQCDYYSEAAAVALEYHGKTTGVLLEVDGDKSIQYKLKWKSKIKKSGWREPINFVRDGATGISFFLTVRLTEFEVFEESGIGTGIDYWLSYKEENPNYNPTNYLNARLEISGIKKESESNSLLKRMKVKTKQTKRSDSTKLPAYISIVEFSTPKANFFKRK
jgi:hypothetical protein